MKALWLFCLFMWPLQLSHTLLSHRIFAIWDVGQGLWVTAIGRQRCHHFDFGGEKNSHLKWLKHCQNKENRHYLSHLDWDHLNYLKFITYMPLHCRYGEPYDQSRKSRLNHYLRTPACLSITEDVQELEINQRKTKPNELSRVFVYDNWALLPGESTKLQERHWRQSLPRGIQILVLGHHGCHTSTSKTLLERLPELRFAIASARKAKYGHPHRDVQRRLKSKHIPLLLTEDWGNIIIERP
jgi:competence protein ComEC